MLLYTKTKLKKQNPKICANIGGRRSRRRPPPQEDPLGSIGNPYSFCRYKLLISSRSSSWATRLLRSTSEPFQASSV